MIGFDLGRTSNPPERYASASGLINVGGFLATLLLVLAIGWVLDWRSVGGDSYTPAAFRWAMSVQFLLFGLGLVQMVRYRVRARAHQLALEGPGSGAGASARAAE
jgi:cytochrome bd-type quinol oxidase subunit 2